MRLPGPENAVLAYIANAKHKAAVICKPAKGFSAKRRIELEVSERQQAPVIYVLSS